MIEARVQDYLSRYDVPAREALDVRWALTCMELEDEVERLEAVLSPVLLRRAQAKLWQALYYHYDYAQPLAAPAGSQPARSESRLGKTDGLPAKAKRAIKIIDGTVLNNR